MNISSISKFVTLLAALLGFAYIFPFLIIVYVLFFLIWLNKYVDVRNVRESGYDGYGEVIKSDMLPGTKGKYESYYVEFKFQDKVYAADAVPKEYLGNTEKVRIKYTDLKKLYFYNGDKLTMLFARVKR